MLPQVVVELGPQCIVRVAVALILARLKWFRGERYTRYEVHVGAGDNYCLPVFSAVGGHQQDAHVCCGEIFTLSGQFTFIHLVDVRTLNVISVRPVLSAFRCGNMREGVCVDVR